MKKHLIYLFLILIIIAGSAIVNKLPAGHIVSGSDFPYILNVENHMNDALYVWSNVGNGQGSPDRPISVVFRYFAIYPLKVIGLSDTQILNTIFFMFILLAATSMYLALGILTDFKTRPFIYFIVALFYSFNSFTIYGFTASWMYHPIFDVYIFLPLIFVLFYKGLVDNNKRYLAISVIVFLLSLSGFSNPAYLVALLIFLFLFVAILFFLGRLDKRTLLTASIVCSLYILVLAFYLIPLSYEFLFGTTFKFNTGNVINIASSNVINSWRLMNDNPFLFFPNNFPYLASLKPLYSVLSICPAILMILSLFLVKEKNKKIVLTFGTLLIVFTYIAVKINFPYFQNFTMYLFSLPLLNGLRAADKTYPFIAFISAVLLFYFLDGVFSGNSSNRFKKVENYLLAGCLAIILIFPLPFFAGKFQQTMTMDDRHLPFSHLVKVPQAYKELAEYVNRKDKSTYKILHMPYGGLPYGFEATRWSYYSKWRFLGSDITRYLFNQPVINPTDSIGNYNFGQYFYKKPKTEVFTNTFRLLSARYLIVDKNVSSKYYRSFRKMITENDFKSNFKLLKRFKNLELYKINKDKELPHIYFSSAKELTYVVGDADAIPIILADLNSKPLFFLSKSITPKPLSILKSADTVIFPEGEVLDLAMDLLPQNIGDINSLRFAINKKIASVNIPSSSTYEVFIRAKKDQENFADGYILFDEVKLQKNKIYSEQTAIAKKFFQVNKGRNKAMRSQNKYNSEGRWRYKGAITLLKGNHSLTASQKVEEVVIVQKNDFQIHISSIQKILANKPKESVISKNIRSGYFQMLNKKYTGKRIESRIKFSKINPTKYTVSANSIRPNWLIFSESFHKGWKAYYGKVNWWQALWQKPISEDKHMLINGYANAWYIDKPGRNEITLYFWPQSLFYISLIISALTLLGSIGYLGYDWLEKKRTIK